MEDKLILRIVSTDEFVQPFSGTIGNKKKRAINKRKEKGIYIIKENGVIVYIGMSQSCVVEALYRHFYHYNDTHKNPRHFYNINEEREYTVYVIFTNHQDAVKLERGLVLGINPRDNRDKFKLYLDKLCIENINNSQKQNEL